MTRSVFVVQAEEIIRFLIWLNEIFFEAGKIFG